MNSSTALHDTFKKLIEELSFLLESEGMAARPYANPNLIFFKQMDQKLQVETISGLKHYLEAAKRVHRVGRSLKEVEFFVKTGLEYYGFEPHPEFSDRAYKKNVVVEFYSLKGLQLFRTINFFETTSYTLEDIYCRQWVDLYERPAELVKKMFEEIDQFATNKDPTVTLIYGPHSMRERVSLERLETSVKEVHISPLCRTGQMVALSSLVLGPSLEGANR